MMRNILALSCLLVLWQPVVEAAMLVQYPFSSDTLPVLGAGVQSSNFGSNNLNSFIVGDDGFGNVLQAYPTLGVTDHDSALANNGYFSISVTANVGSYLDLGNLQFEVGKGGSSDPRGYLVRSSVDSFASDIFSTLLPPGAQQAPALQSINLALPAFQNLSSVEFRFYVFTPSTARSVDFRSLELDSVNVPEPTTLWLLGTGGMLLAGRRASRKQAS